MSRSDVSRHIGVLRRARLVRERRSGRNRGYALAPEPLRLVDAWIATYRKFWKSGLRKLKRYAEAEPVRRSTKD